MGRPAPTHRPTGWPSRAQPQPRLAPKPLSAQVQGVASTKAIARLPAVQRSPRVTKLTTARPRWSLPLGAHLATDTRSDTMTRGRVRPMLDKASLPWPNGKCKRAANRQPRTPAARPQEPPRGQPRRASTHRERDSKPSDIARHLAHRRVLPGSATFHRAGVSAALNRPKLSTAGIANCATAESPTPQSESEGAPDTGEVVSKLRR